VPPWKGLMGNAKDNSEIRNTTSETISNEENSNDQTREITFSAKFLSFKN